jgi:hypothetical protein
MAHEPELEVDIETGSKLPVLDSPDIPAGAPVVPINGTDIDTGSLITSKAEIGLSPAN